MTSDTERIGTISNSFEVCIRRARWRAVVVLPDPGPPIIVVIGCDWTLLRIFGKLLISWNGLSPFSQDSRSALCCSTKHKWYEMLIACALPKHDSLQDPPSVWESTVNIPFNFLAIYVSPVTPLHIFSLYTLSRSLPTAFQCYFQPKLWIKTSLVLIFFIIRG